MALLQKLSPLVSRHLNCRVIPSKETSGIRIHELTSNHDVAPAARVSSSYRTSLRAERPPSEKDEFYVNLGLAVRTLREDLPLIFKKDLVYDIYRGDITFTDPLITITGIEKYKLLFWALRFHGKFLFKEISLDVLRIWQPSDKVILIRWKLKGIPRVPWEASGEFQGTSRYKVDKNGKIYEHRVDNLVFNFRQQWRESVAVLELVTSGVRRPEPTFMKDTVGTYTTSSWLELYLAVWQTLDGEYNELNFSYPVQRFIEPSLNI